MKKICMGACLVASLGFCSLAMAKDIDAIDVFAGNSLFVIASADISSLANNQTVHDLIVASGDKGIYSGTRELAKYGVDYKKDIKSVVLAIDVNRHSCFVFDTSKSIKDGWNQFVQKEHFSSEKYGNYDVVAVEDDGKAVLLSDKRLLFCEPDFDTNRVLDNVAKPKTLKATDSVLYTAYSQTSAKSEVRIAGKMVDFIRREVTEVSISDGNVSVSAADAEAVSVSFSMKKGASLDVRVLTKSDKVAADAASIVNKQYVPMLSDPALAREGLGFLASVVKVASSKKYLTVNVKLTADHVATLIGKLARNNAR